MGRGRFAPSPSGPLHLGNLRTALLAWLFARSASASFVLRIEDLDRPRVRPGASAAMLDDLRWLGLDWDEGPDKGGPHAPYTQSERMQHYVEHLRRLEQDGLVYPCYCSRADLTRAPSAPQEGDAPQPPYPGTCRDANSRHAKQRAHPDRRPSYRFMAPRESIQFVDRVAGQVSQDLAREVGDFVVWRADGVPAYQLAVVVDDALMRIGEAVRGADLLDSTPRQIALYRALGYPIPAFAHVPLLRDVYGARLAKREGAAGLAPLRAVGVDAAEVVGDLAASCGMVPTGTRCRAVDLLPGFDPAGLFGAHPPTATITNATNEADLEEVRALFSTYACTLDPDASRYGIDAELAALPGVYAPPHGRLLIARLGSRACGCVALRRLDAGMCELKRLYVHPEARRSGMGRALVQRALLEARDAGYSAVRLDTLPSMASAIALYRSLGFRQIPPYGRGPSEDALFMQRDLGED